MRQLGAALVAASLLAVAAEAGDAPDLRRLFPRERDVFVERDGLARIAVPPDVLAACRADLADLRIFDREEREVPYLVDAGLPPDTEIATVRTLPVEVVDVRRSELRREDGPPVHRETYVLEAPPGDGVAWDLVFDVAGRRFVRRLAIGAEGAPPAVTGSIFRLPELAAEKIRVTLPPTPERLTVTLEGEEGGYLEPRLRFETASTVAAARDRLAFGLEERSRRREHGRTVIELERPRGVVPDVLELVTATGSFNRGIEVWDEAPGRSPILLARGRVFRVQAPLPIEEREIVVQPARGDRLRLEIDDGDSPALEALRVSAAVRQPVLIAALRGAGDTPAARLRFGGGRAHAPRYDVAAFLPADRATLANDRATAAARLYDPAATSPARLGEPRDNPVFDRTPALAFAMRAGASVDARAWTHRRAIAVRRSPEGLTRVRLTAADLAQARPDLADVRIVDAESRQWPYLLDRESAEAWLDLGVAGPTSERRASIYELRLPTSPIVLATLALETEAPFFDRAIVVTGRGAADRETTLLAGRFGRQAGTEGAVTLALRPERIQSLRLRIEDGNDAPLGFRSVRALVRERDLYLVAPVGEYTLLVGNDDAPPPRYELERVRDAILAVSTDAAEPTELTANPTYTVRARLAAGERLERTAPVVVLWVVLVGAVVVLTAVTLRLARRGESGGGKSEPA